MNPITSWVDLEAECPIQIDRIINYANSFNAKIPSNYDDLSLAKSKLIDAKGDFDLMTTTLMQLLHDSEVITKSGDLHLFTRLCENLGRYLKKVDEMERALIIENDSQDPNRSTVTVASLSSYSKLLKVSCNSIIYETLLKSTKEYHSIKEEDAIEKNKRTFLYILFDVLQVTLSVLGQYTRESTSSINKVFNNYNSGYKRLLSTKGQEIIKQDMEEEINPEGVGKIEELFEESDGGEDVTED